ncbi:MAG: class I tRNA ligase family protein [Candidatus Pacearchaeota archaeon]
MSKKEFVFLHAYGDSSQDSFWNWLKREVENRGGKVVFMPDLPNTNAPKIEEQLKFVNDNYVFKENTIVVGHSLGNILMMKILEKLKIKISGFVMVGAPLPRLIEEYKNGKAFKDLKPRPFLAGYCDWKFDYNKIKEKAHKIIVLEDENDHIVHRDDPKKLAELLNAEYILSIGNKTHYNGEKEEKVLDCIFKKWPIFTTRPDTIYGVTFMVVSAQHSRLFELVTDKQKKEVEKFLKKIKSVSEKEQEEMEKEGVFTGSYAINPVTKEKVPVYAGNFVLADYGSGMVMAVPAHDERDFQFAKKYGIAVKQVIAPMFNNTFEKDAVRLDKKIEERDSVFIIVKHWKEDKYFCLDWKEHKWKSFLMGGIEKGETPEQAAIRETKEETGYFDMKSVKQIGMEVHSKFYAGHKDVNRYGKYKMFVIELKSDKHKKINEEETKNHNGLWIDKNKILNFLNLENHKYAWEIYSNGERAYTDKGILINSSEFNGINNDDAKKKITEFLEKKKLGKAVVNYKFRDWLISRQRYWGTPIPIIYCDKCGAVPVPEKDLPVELPEKVKFGKGNPLETNSEWVSVKCPKCKSDARRETDTMDTFFDSSWYYLRYCDNKNDKKPFDSKKIDYWMPVDFYIGGAEHACMHLIYARFFTKALRDLGFLKFDEPFLKLFNQGMLHGSDGEKMSKSKGNVINPDEVSKKYGIDTARLFLVSVASPDKDIDWSEKGIEGSLRLINKIFYYFENLKTGKSSLKTESKINKAIKEITEDIENLRYNLAVIKLRQLFESFENEESISKKDAESFLKLLSVFCPHISEEIWNKIGNKDFISLSEWPKSDEKKINEKLEQEEKQLEKLAEDINNILKIVETKGEKVSKGYVYCVPPELANYKSGIEIIEKKTNIKIEVFAVNDKNKIDPENKSSRAKFGKPAIYLEQ